jgi:hypothetical protein
MYQKIARVGPISFGIFFALLVFLLMVVCALLGVYVLPMLATGTNTPPITIFQEMSGPIMAMTESQDGLIQLAITAGFMLLGLFIVGLVFAILYNIVAFITGGIKVRVTDLGYDDI